MLIVQMNAFGIALRDSMGGAEMEPFIPDEEERLQELEGNTPYSTVMMKIPCNLIISAPNTS